MDILQSLGHYEMIGRLIFAAGLSALVGLERDVHGRAAGLRTHLLVGMGSALFTLLSYFISAPGATNVATDPGRIAAQIVTGIGFLGAGAIMKEGFSVRGLTTAACFWIVAAIGMATAMGEYILAVVSTILTLASLSLLHYPDKIYKKESYRTLIISVPNNIKTTLIADLIERKCLSIFFINVDKDYSVNTKTITFALRILHRGRTDEILEDIINDLEHSEVPVKRVVWEHGKLF